MIKKRMWHRTKKLFRHRFNTTSILILSFCALIAIPMVLVSVIYYANEKTSIEETSLQYENQIFDDLERDFERLLSQYGEAKYEITSQFLSLDIDEINYDALRTEDVEKIKLLKIFCKASVGSLQTLQISTSIPPKTHEPPTAPPLPLTNHN